MLPEHFSNVHIFPAETSYVPQKTEVPLQCTVRIGDEYKLQSDVLLNMKINLSLLTSTVINDLTISNIKINALQHYLT